MLILQILRGNTHNFIFVDESCFVKPAAYIEVIPMLLTDHGHMVLTSSHKAGQDTRSYIDIKSLRIAEILVNNIVHVCANHVLSMLNKKLPLMSCLCNVFLQPHHITADAGYRRILDTFSTTSSSRNEHDSSEFKTALLSELGIITPYNTMEDTRDTTHRHLATRKGRDRFCSNFIDVSQYVVRKKKEFNFKNVVVVYIDPTPTDVGRSLHAMCFVCKAKKSSMSCKDTVQSLPSLPLLEDTVDHYVLLAAEEFATDDISSDGDALNALSSVFITTVHVLTLLYDAYFTEYIVAIEANSMQVDSFWSRCYELYDKYPILHENGIKILSTAILLPNSKKKTTSKVPKMNNNPRFSPYDVSSYELNMLSEENQLRNHTVKNYRIGYVLDSSKVERIYNFFSLMYNPVSGNASTVLCSKELWGHTIMCKSDSLPYYVAQKLDLLEIRPVVNHTTGEIKYKISGKGRSETGDFVQDDLAIAVVLSVSLAQDIFTNKYEGDFVNLKNGDTLIHHYQLDGYGGL